MRVEPSHTFRDPGGYAPVPEWQVHLRVALDTPARLWLRADVHEWVPVRLHGCDIDEAAGGTEGRASMRR